MKDKYLSAPFIGIQRHKLYTDGNGVTTLVGFHGCPLNCKYCLNPQAKSIDGIWRTLTTKELFDILKVDDILFRATFGGITFGGGEPGLYPDFIKEFSQLCGKEWRITLETSLNFDKTVLKTLCSFVDSFIIDIKDFDSTIYKNYTGMYNTHVIENLKYLSEYECNKIIEVRIPLIPNFNTEDDRDKDYDYLENLGDRSFPDNVRFINYITDPQNEQDYYTENWKEKCYILKEIKERIARKNDIHYMPVECNHEGNCIGTCEECERELKMLSNEIEKRASIGEKVTLDGIVRRKPLYFDKNKSFNDIEITGGYIPFTEEEIDEDNKM